MARIVIATAGVRGDLNPFLALAVALRTRGHSVCFAVERTFAAAVADEGFEHSEIPGDVLAELSPHLPAVLGGSVVRSVPPIVRAWLTPDLVPKVEALVAATRGADLLVARAAHLPAPIAAEVLRLPWVQVTMTALTVPSAETEPAVVGFPPGLARSRLARRAAWAGLELGTRRLADGPVNDARRRFGLPPVRNALGRGGHSPYLTAVAVSPALSPRRPDWPAYVATTGYCFWDVPSSWCEPTGLSVFLARPEPVVAVSLGSVAPFVGGALDAAYGTAVEAVLAAGASALVVGAPAPPAAPADRVFASPFVPFSRVYPLCAAAIHHGGAYTVGEALRAGIPSLAVPWGIDQFFTAAELVRSGAGLAVPIRRLTPRAARRAVDRLLGDESLRRRAAGLGERIAAEDGAGTLCAAVEGVLAKERVGSPS